MIIHVVHYEVGKPGVLPGCLEQFIEEVQALLPEMVSEDLEGHDGRVVKERLREKSQAVVFYIVIGHVQVDQGFVLGESLRNCLGTIV